MSNKSQKELYDRLLQEIEIKTNDSLLNEKETCTYLRLAVQTLRNWRHMGINLPYVRVGRRSIRYRLSDLITFLESNQINPRN